MKGRADVDALLFDIGGVVVSIDFNRALGRWAACAGAPIDALRSRFSFDAAYDRHERGEIQAAEYFASLRTSLGIDLSDAEFAEGWTAIYLGAIPAMAALLGRLKDRVPLYAFTNSNPTHQRFWAAEYAETLACFRKVFVSSDMGLRKPEAAAFRVIAAEIGAPLERILFLDDTRDNVEGARAVGMQTLHVRSVDDTVETLAGLFL